MQPPTDNLYKFLAIFGLIVGALSVYVPLLKYMEFNRLSQRTDAIYRPMIAPLSTVANLSRLELDCAIYQAYVRDKQPPPKPDPCPKAVEARSKADAAKAEVDRLTAQVSPLEVERDSVWQEYVLLLYFGVAGLVAGIAMCVAGFWLWYVRLQRFLDASVAAQAASGKPVRLRVSRSRRGA